VSISLGQSLKALGAPSRAYYFSLGPIKDVMLSHSTQALRQQAIWVIII